MEEIWGSICEERILHMKSEGRGQVQKVNSSHLCSLQQLMSFSSWNIF